MAHCEAMLCHSIIAMVLYAYELSETSMLEKPCSVKFDHRTLLETRTLKLINGCIDEADRNDEISTINDDSHECFTCRFRRRIPSHVQTPDVGICML
jgi:hypothetical protein